LKFPEKSFVNPIFVSILLLALGVVARVAQLDELPRRGFLGVSLSGVSEEMRAQAACAA